MINLYAVNYSYKLPNGNIEHDTWYIGAKSSQEINNTMELNMLEFSKNGLELLNYSFRTVVITDNNYKVVLEHNYKVALEHN